MSRQARGRSSRRGWGRLDVKALFPPPSGPLLQFDREEHRARDEWGEEKVTQRQRTRVERTLEYGHKNNGELEADGEGDGPDQVPVPEEPRREHGLPGNADREDMKHLEHRDRVERKRLGKHDVPIGIRPQVQTEGAGGHEGTDPRDVERDPAREDSFLWIPGPSLHQAPLFRFDAEREGGEAVGNEVDPQELNWKER